jgi:hypothetical protein
MLSIDWVPFLTMFTTMPQEAEYPRLERLSGLLGSSLNLFLFGFEPHHPTQEINHLGHLLGALFHFLEVKTWPSSLASRTWQFCPEYNPLFGPCGWDLFSDWQLITHLG